jgi:Tfp pilus assembly protein FimT
MMKKSLLSIIAILSSLFLFSQNENAKPYLTKTFGAVDKVFSKTTGGNISVTPADKNDTRVEVFIHQNNKSNNKLSDEEIKSRLADDYELTIAAEGGKLTVMAKPKHRIKDWKRSLSISFKIYAAKDAALDLSTGGGNIHLAGLSGDKVFRTSGGNLVLSDLSGKSKGETSGGNIILKNSKDIFNLRTSGGNIQAENSSGDIDISTSGGNILVENLKGTVKVKTSGGNIKCESVEGELLASTSGGNVSLQNLDCSLKTSTSGGNIDVTMKGVGNYVSIINSSGRVRLQIPKESAVDLKLSAMKISTGNMEHFKGSISKEDVDGSLNGGGVLVKIDASSGDIDLGFN